MKTIPFFSKRVWPTNASFKVIVASLVVGGCTLIACLPSTHVNAQPPLPLPAGESPVEDGIETLTQGPIHEAFANPAELDPTPGPVVAKQPPVDVQEEPPEFMPEDSIWIPGYWIWDDERDDFVWVTGVARKSPPKMRYVPGYWTEADGGWQRVSGFWVGNETVELNYREPPPNSLDTGPSSPAPTESHFWIPGNWNYYDTGYRWQAGYWSNYQPNWIWCPTRWVWTPAGSLYVPGYWDYSLSFRGQMFAPVYFRTAHYRQPTWRYRPWCVIPTTNLFVHLWVRPRHSHYYFGNYYGPRYVNSGFHSWVHYSSQRRHYDPFYSYCHVHYRKQNIDFIGRVQGWHDHFDRHEDQRPSRTWQEQQARRSERGGRPAVEAQLVARNIVEVARRDDAPLKLVKLDQRTREAVKDRSDKIRQLDEARKSSERTVAVAVDRPGGKGDKSREAREESKPRSEQITEATKGERNKGDRPPGSQTTKLKLPKTSEVTVRVGGNQANQSKSVQGRSAPKDNKSDEAPPPRADVADGPTGGKNREQSRESAKTRDNNVPRSDDLPRTKTAKSPNTEPAKLPTAETTVPSLDKSKSKNTPSVRTPRPGSPSIPPVTGDDAKVDRPKNEPVDRATKEAPKTLEPGKTLPDLGSPKNRERETRPRDDARESGPLTLPKTKTEVPKTRVELPKAKTEVPRTKSELPKAKNDLPDEKRETRRVDPTTETPVPREPKSLPQPRNPTPNRPSATESPRTSVPESSKSAIERLEAQRAKSKILLPRLETQPNEAPKIERPAPRIDSPKRDTPKVDSSSIRPPTARESARIAPNTEATRPAPRVESSRPKPQPVPRSRSERPTSPSPTKRPTVAPPTTEPAATDPAVPARARNEQP